MLFSSKVDIISRIVRILSFIQTQTLILFCSFIIKFHSFQIAFLQSLSKKSPKLQIFYHFSTSYKWQVSLSFKPHLIAYSYNRVMQVLQELCIKVLIAFHQFKEFVFIYYLKFEKFVFIFIYCFKFKEFVFIYWLLFIFIFLFLLTIV